MVGEVFPVSGNLPGGNQYYDRWQAWLYPGNSTGLAANGKMSPFFYTNYYKFIFTANEAIDIANQSEGAEEMMGIAKTFRALCFWRQQSRRRPFRSSPPLRARFRG